MPSECERCPELCESRTRIVDGVGPVDADLMFVGEAPGQQEDEQGEPFVGQSGTILDNALDQTTLRREDVFITNAVRCRPEDNRDPTALEKTNCYDYLEREIMTVDPALIMPLGAQPASVLLPDSVPYAVTGDAGETFTALHGPKERTIMLNMHPAATIYGQDRKATFTEAVQSAVEYVQ